ncbi:plasmid SOS inhibition protein A [Pantoea piersonii]|uniref:plasmid SOS inhibition protein A n=1 Tax=Pantoea piersonii TaxID=2364647 RepID=UPI0022F18A1F|nr:plasmid SOS inhibition protein A [Pantoea piersonii]WBV24386.1 plasmid SOS inhibition protein A [Pantoea piersonii]
MNTIPRHLSLVPACPYSLAISLAIAEVEKRLQGRAARGAHPYASAFMRHYCGTRTIKADQLRRVMPEYSPGDRAAPPARDYLAALDMLIASRGERCPSPLSQDTGSRLFPLTAARFTERREKRLSLRQNREHNREAREREQKRRRYQNRLAQAALELAFHTPQTAGRWYAHWQGRDIYENDLQSLVLTWLKRFVSCRHIDPWEWHDEPLWRVMLDISILAGEMSAVSSMTDRFALPVLLTYRT